MKTSTKVYIIIDDKKKIPMDTIDFVQISLINESQSMFFLNDDFLLICLFIIPLDFRGKFPFNLNRDIISNPLNSAEQGTKNMLIIWETSVCSHMRSSNINVWSAITSSNFSTFNSKFV